jgi:integrase
VSAAASLGERVEEYLRLRRALGYQLRNGGHHLAEYARYPGKAGETSVTVQNAVTWARLRQDVRPVTWSHRLRAVRGFAAWLRTVDPATEVPPAGMFPARWKRPAPFIFSDGDIARMAAACGSLRPRFRSATYTALFGLVAVSGVRIGEALSIPVAGIDLDAGLLPVRPAKSRRERILPLHPTTVAALAGYEELRAREHPGATTFFASVRGTRLWPDRVMDAFREACAIAGIPGRPRIHDLRHSLAVATLLDWYRSGEDIAAQMPALSGYLGHVSPESTYWYISAVPELMQLAAGRASGKERP